MKKEMQHIRRFNEADDRQEISNYVVSYTKDTTKTDVDVSIGSNNLDDLIVKLKSMLSDVEFDSIFKIEIGPMPFG